MSTRYKLTEKVHELQISMYVNAGLTKQQTHPRNMTRNLAHRGEGARGATDLTLFHDSEHRFRVLSGPRLALLVRLGVCLSILQRDKFLDKFLIKLTKIFSSFVSSRV